MVATKMFMKLMLSPSHDMMPNIQIMPTSSCAIDRKAGLTAL